MQFSTIVFVTTALASLVAAIPVPSPQAATLTASTETKIPTELLTKPKVEPVVNKDPKSYAMIYLIDELKAIKDLIKDFKGLKPTTP